MENVDYLIIGGGISGVSAAETIRTEDQKSRVAIVTNETQPLYSRVRLPYYLRKIKTRDEMFLRSFDDFKTKGIRK